MSKLLNLKADGTFNVSVEEHLFDNIRKAHTWYTSKFTSFPALVLLALIDIIGFKQIIDLTVVESNANRFAITASLAIAFDLASLYLGYALCLKCYHLGRLIHNWALAFSLTACGLGIIANAVFRILTMNAEDSIGNDAQATGCLPHSDNECCLCRFQNRRRDRPGDNDIYVCFTDHHKPGEHNHRMSHIESITFRITTAL